MMQARIACNFADGISQNNVFGLFFLLFFWIYDMRIREDRGDYLIKSYKYLYLTSVDGWVGSLVEFLFFSFFPFYLFFRRLRVRWEYEGRKVLQARERVRRKISDPLHYWKCKISLSY